MLAVANTTSKTAKRGSYVLTPFFYIYFFSFLLCYNSFMEYILVVIDSFWAIMEQCATIFLPIIVIFILFRLIKTAIRG